MTTEFQKPRGKERKLHECVMAQRKDKVKIYKCVKAVQREYWKQKDTVDRFQKTTEARDEKYFSIFDKWVATIEIRQFTAADFPTKQQQRGEERTWRSQPTSRAVK